MDLVTRGLHVKPNTQYSPPTTHVGDLMRPVAVTKLTEVQLLSPIVDPGGQCLNLSIILWSHTEGHIGKLSRRGARVGSIALRLPRALLKPPRSQVLRRSLSQWMSGQSSVTPLPLPRRLKHLARSDEEAVLVRVAKRNPNPQPDP